MYLANLRIPYIGGRLVFFVPFLVLLLSLRLAKAPKRLCLSWVLTKTLLIIQVQNKEQPRRQGAWRTTRHAGSQNSWISDISSNILSGDLSDIPSGVLSKVRFDKTFFLAHLLTYVLSYLPTFFLADLLTFFLIFFFWHSVWHIFCHIFRLFF